MWASERPISARLPSELVDLPRGDRHSVETAFIRGRLFNKYVAVCKLREWHPRGAHPALSQARTSRSRTGPESFRHILSRPVCRR